MTELSTDGTGTHEAGVLGVSGSGGPTKGAYVLRALGTDMFGGLALETVYHGGSGWFRVRDDDGVVTSSGLHNHLQSSGECNTSSSHSRSASLVSPSPASLSRHRVVMILFPCGKGSSSRTTWEGVGSLGHLGRRVDSSVSGG